jgi:hypothetical protein
MKLFLIKNGLHCSPERSVAGKQRSQTKILIAGSRGSAAPPRSPREIQMKALFSFNIQHPKSKISFLRHVRRVKFNCKHYCHSTFNI